tara:strand:- start:115 stop:249 length:135 start_codon:yes stop_codon:yes gene_type:complete
VLEAALQLIPADGTALVNVEGLRDRQMRVRVRVGVGVGLRVSSP